MDTVKTATAAERNHEDAAIPPDYSRYIGRKIYYNAAGMILLVCLFLLSISVGSVSIPFHAVIRTLLSRGSSSRWETIIVQIRLPHSLAALAAGAGLSVSGAAMQTILRNPLGSPFTLGISNAAAFGAAFSVMILGSGTMHSTGADAVIISSPYLTTLSAFVFCLLTAGIILAVSKIKHASPEVMVLTGIALGALYSAGTMFLQYFADDVQLAAMVFWTFGDLARVSWKELAILSVVTVASLLYFFSNRWNYNALSAGDETAASLGVPVARVRLIGMVAASLVTATIISFVGIIGFVGLVCPHMVRRVIGSDHRFFMTGSALTGSLLLLAADMGARLVMAPHVLPVAILTSFLGAPVFIYLLIRGYRR
jgi:iron complex transport system permease protein